MVWAAEGRKAEDSGDSRYQSFFFSSRRRHTRCGRDWSSDVCSSDLTDNIVHPLGQLVEYPLYAFFGQGVFVTGLGGRQDPEVIAMLILDQGLGQVGFLIDHIDEIINDAALAVHDQVQVAQAHVKVDDGSFVATQGKTCGYGRTGRGLSDSAFTRGHRDDSGQG